MEIVSSRTAPWFWSAFGVCGAVLLVTLLVVGLPSEGEAKAWLFVTPFLMPLLWAEVLALLDRPGPAVSTLTGGLLGATGTLVVLYFLLAATMSS